MQPIPPKEFSLAYEPLDPADPALGRAAVIPWDTEIFGFPVAQFQPGERLPGEALSCWARRTGAELIAATAPAPDRACASLLSAAGFHFVDFSLNCRLALRGGASLPSRRLQIRLAEVSERPAIKRIAGTAFRAGRYHMDPRFPEALANRRYERWIANAFAGGEEVYVAGPPGEPHCFCHVARRDELLDIRLIGVEKSAQGGFYGPELLAAVLNQAQAAGARRALARISASNVAALNLYAALGFRFFDPEAIFHWHAPGAPHLLPGIPL